jgi:glucokinase
VLIDILNPEAIILGGIFLRCEALLRPSMDAEIGRESLAASRAACRILPASLGESVGDYAALAIAFGGGPEENL